MCVITVLNTDHTVCGPVCCYLSKHRPLAMLLIYFSAWFTNQHIHVTKQTSIGSPNKVEKRCTKQNSAAGPTVLWHWRCRDQAVQRCMLCTHTTPVLLATRTTCTTTNACMTCRNVEMCILWCKALIFYYGVLQ